MASAMGTLRRPMEITSRGQGGSSGSLDCHRAEQPFGRHEDLQRRREKPHGALGADPLQGVGQADSLGHGDALCLHADRAVGDDPGLVGAGFAALGDQRRGAVRRLAGRGFGGAKISGMENAQFLFNSFAWKDVKLRESRNV